jgi:phospholipid-binding lipoprotein MlaA
MQSTSGDDSAFAEGQDEIPVSDPYEKFNRVMFGFNDMLDRFVIRPAARLYNKIIPLPLNRGIDHVFENFYTLRSALNDAAQYNFYQAVSDSWRFALNSTIGIGGFFDVANEIGLPPNTEDFGLTLAQWGYTQSDYLVLPFFGALTIRDAIGLPVDYYTSFYPYFHPWTTQLAIKSVDVVDKRAQLLRFQEAYETATLDKYVFIRSAYMQRRQYLIDQNTQPDNPYTVEETQKMHEDHFLDE